MRFTVHIMQADSVEASVDLLARPDESPLTVAARGREELLDKGMRMKAARSQQVMSEATLERFADVFAQVVLEQATSGERRFVTAYTRGTEEVYQSEGQIALLSQSGDLTCLIEVVDDVALERNSFATAARSKLGHAASPRDLLLEDVTDMDRSFDK